MIQNPLLPGALYLKYGDKPGLTYFDGMIENWPTALLGPFPSDATIQQAITDYQAYLALAPDREAKLRVDDKMIKAVTIYLMQRINELRTQPTTIFPALTAQEVRDGIIAIYKTL